MLKLVYQLFLITGLQATILNKSRSDHREYKHFKLSNDLEVILINDLDADKAAASLDVNVGSVAELTNYPAGTAHFLEHMLFMGSEKFPNETDYKNFITNAGGKANAYTSNTDTNYHFDVKSDALEGALDRFSQFFIAPLMKEDAVEREMKAVDSEYTMSLQNDMWRNDALFNYLSHPDSNQHRFRCGNIDTLKVDKIVENLKDFHKEFYSANIMKLVVSSKHSLEQMEKWAIQYF
jgi:insulysin